MPGYWVLGAALAVSLGWSSAAMGADVTLSDEYSKLIQQHSRIGTLDGGFFGDHVNLSNGGLEFVQTDVDLPGNNGLDVRVGRRFVPGESTYPPLGHFAYWDLDIPHLHGVFAQSTTAGVYWRGPGIDPEKRCSEFGAPPAISVLGGNFDSDEFWHGNMLYLPGGGDQEMLSAPATTGDVPDDGHAYPVVTRDGAVARCLSALAPTSEASSAGEGFEVVTPEGTVYTFDQMVSREVAPLRKSSNGLYLRGRPPRLPRGSQTAVMVPNSPVGFVMQRREAILYPTKVSDRFGNTVTYTWSSSNPWRLLQIAASDGRHLDFTYSALDSNSYVVQTVSDGTRTWTYTHRNVTEEDATTDTFTQPDGGTWRFALDGLYRSSQPHPYGVTCDEIAHPDLGGPSGTITAPSGATASYTLAATLFGRSWIGRSCSANEDGSDGPSREPYLFESMALASKIITGPGLPGTGLVWSYAYGPPNNCWSGGGGSPGAVACVSGSSPITRTTTVTAPDGAVNRYTFGNKFRVNEGLLVKQEFGVSGSSALRTVDIVYAEPTAAPYAAHNGTSPRNFGDYDITGLRRPQRSVTTNQQDQDFVWSVPNTCGGTYCFDARARPTTIVRSGINTPAATQAESIFYDDDTAHWVLGQVARRTVDGLAAAQTIFDANHLPWKVYAFGTLQNTFTYDTTSAINTGQRGTLKTAKDGNNNVTTYTSWKRGIPQSVAFADSHSRTAVVADPGWITSVTDENGFATAYAYDTMGRITQVTYPTGDSVAWAPSTSVFEPVGSAENGVPLGHWRETVSTGNARKITLFDALWRPVLVREYDTGDVAGTDHYLVTAYDKAGRVIEASYPLATAPTMTNDATWDLPGVRTSYDALGRPTSVQQDSELGVLTSTTEYLLTNFQRRVTDARGHATTESFMAWDSPTFDWPIQVDAPEDETTLIARDIFGKPTAITREATP